MKIGDFQLQAVETGHVSLDGGAMFGVVPKTLWSKVIPPDDQNRIKLALRTLLITYQNKKILIDTGIGTKFNEKLTKIYDVDHSRHTLENSLAQFGLSPNDITDVIFSHLHFDHCGGATKHDGDALRLTFPNAQYHVQKEQWEWAHTPSEKDRASFQTENYDLIKETGQLNLLNGPVEIFPGISTMVMHGHTPGMQLIKIGNQQQHLIYCSDLIPTAAHIPIPWVMAYDNNPMTTLAEKKRLYSELVSENTLLFFEHDPHIAAGSIKKDERGFSLNASFSTDEFNA
jgi:glyoxylase-like metal-dependent hydrolase (beta-lactamase superfamily II)